MRFLLIPFALSLVACGPPEPKPKADPLKSVSYTKALEKLQELNKGAREDLAAERSKDAADKVNEGQPAAAKLLSVSEPPLEAMLAVSDRDQLYAEMLMANRHWGFARQMMATEATRWKNWKPETDETRRRLKIAQDRIAECDKNLFAK
jgi:hypothetical protein